MSGWIKLHRTIKDNWIYFEKRKFSKFEAWIDLLLTVNYADNEVMIKGKIYNVKRGESVLSLDSWSSRWGWDKSATRRFFNLLKKEGMIELQSDNITTHLTICNYDSYQSERHSDDTQTTFKRNANDTQTTPIKEEEEIKEEKEEKELSLEYEFELFWSAYDKKVDSKKCKALFFKLSDEKRSRAIYAAKTYAEYTPDKKYRKNPLTWLRGECWNDELRREPVIQKKDSVSYDSFMN